MSKRSTTRETRRRVRAASTSTRSSPPRTRGSRPHEFDRLADSNLVLADGDEVTLGFDGSKSDDHCALLACRIDDGALFTLGVWDPASYGGEAPRDLIDDAVDRAHARYRVLAFFSDLHPWESYVDKWAEKYGSGYLIKASPRHAVAWDMRGRTKEFTVETERLYDEIVEEQFRHDGHAELKQHFHNARRRPNAWGVSVGKEHRESARKIDAVPPAVLSRAARRLVLASPKRRRKRSGRAIFV